MKLKILLSAFILVIATITEAKIVVPESYTVVHKDSNWYITMRYYVDDIPDNEQLLLTSSICCSDTCINNTARCFQGKKFRKQYNLKNKIAYQLANIGMQNCKIAIPENFASDSLIAITTCTVENKDGITTEKDSMYIYLPTIPPLSCHRVNDMWTNADRIAYQHNFVYPILYYEPLEENNIPSYNQSEFAVNFRPASHILENNYMQNINIIDSISSLISHILSDSMTKIEAIQIVGYSSPGTYERNNKQIGLRRANSLKDKLKYYCNLPDSIFEILDGGKNWELIYESVSNDNLTSSDSIVRILRAETIPKQREIILYKLSNILPQTYHNTVNNHCQACCARIYYQNKPDTLTSKLNNIVNKLTENKNLNYDSLRNELGKYKNDARVLNLIGIINYREHKRNAAKKAFTTAAMMGDEQAMTNLLIITKKD